MADGWSGSHQLVYQLRRKALQHLNTMAKVSLNLQKVLQSGNANGVVLSPQRRRDEEGAVHASCAGGSCTVVVQGRLISGAGFSWMNLTDPTDSQYDMSSGDEKIFTNIPLLPKMRTRIQSATGCTIDIYFME